MNDSPLRVLILGAGGRLGSALAAAWSGDPALSVRSLGRAQINLASPAMVEETLAALEFDLLVNCAAYTAVDDCEHQPAHADLINGHVPGRIARLCADRGARMIHFSTDYVFDGTKAEPYTEGDEPNPLSAYGRSKLLGEIGIRAASPHHLVVRLSWLFGPGRPAFPEWVLREAAGGALAVVADKVACPTFSLDVARWLRPLLTVGNPATGLLHLCNAPACSWLEYAHGILDAAKLDAVLTPITLADLPGLQARRPRNSALDVSKYHFLTGHLCRPWTEALAEHLLG